MGKYSVLDLGILFPFGRADTVDHERNIFSRYIIALQFINNYIIISITSVHVQG